MPRVNPDQQAQAITEALKKAEKNYYQIDERVQKFCQTWESQLQQLASTLQKVEQEEQNFEGDVDQSLKQLEQEVAQSQGLWAALAPGNKLAHKEQVSQKRLALLNGAKKLRQTLQEASQELSVTLKQFQEKTRQLQNDFSPLKQDFQSLAKNLDQLQNGLQCQQSQAGSQMAGIAPQALAASQMPGQPPQPQGGMQGSLTQQAQGDSQGSTQQQSRGGAQENTRQQPRAGVFLEMSQELLPPVGQGDAGPGQPQGEAGTGPLLNQRDQFIMANLQQAMIGLSRAQQLLEHNRVLFQVLQTLDRQLEEAWQRQCNMLN
ncbi:MAG TPA: hypothetical protein GX735_02340 [Firmicutes bacterium]|jgi:hypothetical protein|nr:hypothetical protein [Bacillota bacterium]